MPVDPQVTMVMKVAQDQLDQPDQEDQSDPWDHQESLAAQETRVTKDPQDPPEPRVPVASPVLVDPEDKLDHKDSQELLDDQAHQAHAAKLDLQVSVVLSDHQVLPAPLATQEHRDPAAL